MKIRYWYLVLLLALTGCALSKPFASSSMEISGRTASPPTSTAEGSLGRACAEQMVASAPTPRARDITAQVTRSGYASTVVVHAVLQDVGLLTSELKVTYVCEYIGTQLSEGSWATGPAER